MTTCPFSNWGSHRRDNLRSCLTHRPEAIRYSPVSTEKHGVSVVIPCLNEEQSIGQVVDAAREGLRLADVAGEVVVVDNGCRDRSAAIARQHGARVIREEKPGYGAAIRKGFASARYDILVMADGDLTYDLTKLDQMVRPILAGETDLVVGNRMQNIRPGSMRSLHRYVGNPLLSFLLRVMFHSRAVRDAHCGMRAISRKAYRTLHCVTTGMEFASEMIIRAIHCKLRMRECDIIYHARVGVSKLDSFQDGWRHLRFMLLHSPTMTMLLPGMLVWGIGLVMAIPVAFGPVIVNGRALDLHYMIIGGLLNVVSIQFITIGILAKAYAHYSGLRSDPLIVWLFRNYTFEKLLMWTVPMILIGLCITLKVVIDWVASGFGPLNEARHLFFGMLCLTNGTQIGASGYLLSIMALPRHIGPFAEEDGNDESAGQK
jgi:glycosyltransferase involved in cell wall biosynthesis